MNRFRTRKKAREEFPGGRSGQENDYSLPSFRGFRRGKKQQEEPKPEINLSGALPSNEDFRTSLLMTNLSARFSMLREQDDPPTNIGKATDDTVLSSERHLRMVDSKFGATTLGDITETESLKASPSFVRTGSFVSDDADSMKGGNVVNRSKPTEGNNLFGGRQKIYKIPVGGAFKNGPDGGMGGKAVYEDDVAISSFQRWRQAEKARRTLEGEGYTGEEDDEELARPESPAPAGYEKKRETSSTTSSNFAIGRNSTAATSITSQPSSAKDWQSVSIAPTSSASTPSLERSSTRAKRLYEHGLTQELQEQQTSALSRMDTLTRQRNVGGWTPELGPISTSPTALTFSDRLGDKRQILGKASAPNLRSTSPSTSASPIGPQDLSLKVFRSADSNASFGGESPLSPPISDGGDHPLLPIKPNDRGKATAMGVFQKPLQPYDETKYAQRQLRLQQGRESPSQLFRVESNSSLVAGRSQSSLSICREPSNSQVEGSVRPEPSVQEKDAASSFPDDGDNSSVLPSTSAMIPTLQVAVECSSDQEHPALRRFALATPLSVSPSASEAPDTSPHIDDGFIAVDSPNLEPSDGMGALSGLVRQHLRFDSSTSSVFSALPSTTSPESGEVDGVSTSDSLNQQQQNREIPDGGLGPTLKCLKEDFPHEEAQPGADANLPKPADSGEKDEFARQLADARRRVRDKLTSFAESDSSGSGSSVPEYTPPTLPNALGIVKREPSRGVLIDRSKTISVTQSKAMKLLGIGSTMTSSPTSPSFEYRAEIALSALRAKSSSSRLSNDGQVDHRTGDDIRNEGELHPRIYAFRQARRDLQQQREPSGEGVPSQGMPNILSPKCPEVGASKRSVTLDSSIAMGQQHSEREPGDTEGGNESVHSNADRPARLQHKSTSLGDQLGETSGAPDQVRSPMLRSPGLPGTNIRRSPITPSYSYNKGSTSRKAFSPGPSGPLSTAHSAATLAGPSPQEDDSGRTSPTSPMNLCPVRLPSPLPRPTGKGQGASQAGSSAASTTTSTLNEAMKRVVSKRDISEPTFVMSTSRVPTVNLPQFASDVDDVIGRQSDSNSLSRSRSDSSQHSGGAAPPLPPINPRRRHDGFRTDARAAIDAMWERKGDSHTELPAPTSAVAFSEEENGGKPDGRRRFRKVTAQIEAINARAASLNNGSARDVSPSFAGRRPLASRTIWSAGITGSRSGTPSGLT